MPIHNPAIPKFGTSLDAARYYFNSFLMQTTKTTTITAAITAAAISVTGVNANISFSLLHANAVFSSYRNRASAGVSVPAEAGF
jgi:hypothetical protein